MKSALLLRLLLRLVRGDTEHALLEVIDYLTAESRVLRQRYELDCGRRLRLSDPQRWELAARGRAVIGHGYIIHDGDAKVAPFDAVLPPSTRPIRLPPRSPNLNAYAERFVRSIKSECLDHFTPLGQGFLRRTIREYLAHYHAERNHQGADIGNRLLFPDSRAAATGAGVVRHTRLGGLLSFYHRAAG